MHRISEVFTSGDVSLHNSVVFLSYKPSETCQILLWITKRSYKIFIVKFQMSTCDAGDGIFKSYLTNISIEHSLNTTTKGLLHSITRGKWSLEKYSPVPLLCYLCHNIYHKVAFRSDTSNPDYMWNSRVKICLWTRLVKRDDLNVSTSQWSSHVSVLA